MEKQEKIRTVEAVIAADGRVRLSETIRLDGPRRALVTILADEPAAQAETALLSEPALSQDWDRPEEDEAWAKLPSEQ